MYALTVWQPWAWAIGAGIKLVENRDWLPNWRLLKEGTELAIHAGVHIPTRDEYASMKAMAAEHNAYAAEHGAVGVVRVPELGGHEFGAEYGRGRIVAVATFAGVAHREEDLPEAQRPWWIGKYGWRLCDVRQLNLGNAPKVLGQQGLWSLPPGVEKMVNAQLATTGPGALWRKTA